MRRFICKFEDDSDQHALNSNKKMVKNRCKNGSKKAPKKQAKMAPITTWKTAILRPKNTQKTVLSSETQDIPVI